MTVAFLITAGWSSQVARRAQLSEWAARSGNGRVIPVKFGEAFTGNTEPSPEVLQYETEGKV